MFLFAAVTLNPSETARELRHGPCPVRGARGDGRALGTRGPAASGQVAPKGGRAAAKDVLLTLN